MLPLVDSPFFPVYDSTE